MGRPRGSDASRRRQLGEHVAGQTIQHSLDVIEMLAGVSDLFRRPIREPLGDHQLEGQLAGRSSRNVQEAHEVTLSAPPTALGNIAPDGDGGAPHLTGQPEALVHGEGASDTIDRNGELGRTSQYPQLGGITHSAKLDGSHPLCLTESLRRPSIELRDANWAMRIALCELRYANCAM
jgi:hypothetical protein